MNTQNDEVRDPFSLDFLEVITSFFKLSDWKKRIVYFGLPFGVVGMIALTVLSKVFEFTVSPEKVEDSTVLILLVISLALLPFAYLTGMSVLGYKIKQSEATRDNREIYNLYSFRNFLSRVKHSFLLVILQLIYQLIPIGVGMIGYFILVSSFVFLLDGGYKVGLGLTILGYTMLIASTVLRTAVSFILYPLIGARYINESRFINAASYLQTWKIFFKHLKHILLISLVVYFLQIVLWGMLYVFMYMFLAIALFMGSYYLLYAFVASVFFIPVFAIVSVYYAHIEGILTGKLARIIRNNRE